MNLKHRILLLTELPVLPEMLFSSNSIIIVHEPSDCKINFNPIDALKVVNNKSIDLQVSPSVEWKLNRPETVNVPVFKPHDWTYTTDYMGTLQDGKDWKIDIQPSNEDIDFSKLSKRDRILFYREIDLYEDELSDHGVSKLTLKLRVMPDGFLLLQRFFLKVDGVILRSNETRIYHEFESKYISRTFIKKERKTKEIVRSIDEPSKLFTQSDIVESNFEKLYFNPI
ncbi:hypothetical protein MXB_2707 [Myxobolus squamalis]|nr:hypothetical protein MXB_2707 [Myxobolus squamalis]